MESQLEQKIQELESTKLQLKKAMDDFTEQKEACDASWAQKLEEERSKWRDQAFQHPYLESPVASTSAKANANAYPNSRRSSTLEITGYGSDHFRSSSSRRSSAIPSPLRQDSYASLQQQAAAILSPAMSLSHHPTTIPEAAITPSIMTFEPDDFFHAGPGALATPATPPSISQSRRTPPPFQHQQQHQNQHQQHYPPSHTPRGINDIISESTVGAGPSVQLVERMSATVRRLESERAASKDELARVTAQRDEARQQVVDLMRELDEKKLSDERAVELDRQLQDLDQRYQTTLEMLGEKSELVDELQADIADLKKIYRELVDSTMK